LLEEPAHLATAGLVICEVLQGVRDDRQRRLIQSTLLAMPMLPEPRLATYLAAAGIYRKARRGGLTIRSTIDCVLAAQCIESGADILHRDRDFDAIARVAPLRIFTGRGRIGP
jgi:predicted nucleic acid-binding protein